jgi:aspartyl-tRNA(Asn)/glutamyl-tRNA(Gln) amidotransferase subunit C
MANTPAIKQQDVAHVAKLAHLTLTESEIALFTAQLQAITEHISELDAVDVDNVEPTFQVLDGTQNIWREDELKPGLSQAEALSQASRVHKGYFVVDAVIKEPK